MGTHQDILRSKARTAFPELLPQSEIWREPLNSPFRSDALQVSARTNTVTAAELQVRVTTLSFRNMHNYGDLFVNYLKARHAVFVVQKGWNLPEADGMEFDQYDTPRARWIVVHDFGRILAGIRITPTTAQCGLHSYMLRDAQLGLLVEIPPYVLHGEAPVSNMIWEATRLFVSDDVPSEKRIPIQKLLMSEMASAARSVGASHVVGIVPAIFRRWLNRIGMTATAIGPKLMIDGDFVQAALMNVGKPMLQ